jgi:spore germination protein GerM
MVAGGPITETLYLVKSGMLVAVRRKVPAEPEVNGVMADLLAGPTDAEKGTGIGSALLGSKVVAAVQVHDGIATVELADNLEGTGRNDDVLAFGQIVCTLTTRPGIAWVTFARAGQRIEVPRGDGSLTADPLNAASYSRLIASG